MKAVHQFYFHPVSGTVRRNTSHPCDCQSCLNPIDGLKITSTGISSPFRSHDLSGSLGYLFVSEGQSSMTCWLPLSLGRFPAPCSGIKSPSSRWDNPLLQQFDQGSRHETIHLGHACRNNCDISGAEDTMMMRLGFSRLTMLMMLSRRAVPRTMESSTRTIVST